MSSQTMLARVNALFKRRYFKLGAEIVVIFVIYLAIKSFMQRDLVDGPVPSLEGMLLDGRSVNVQSYQGKPLLLHFWATWCSICKMEENSIAAISEDFEVITVAMNSGTELEISTYLEEQALSFPVVVDEDGIIAERFGVRGVPTSFIIDPEANIEFTEVGYTTELGLRLRLLFAGW